MNETLLIIRALAGHLLRLDEKRIGIRLECSDEWVHSRIIVKPVGGRGDFVELENLESHRFPVGPYTGMDSTCEEALKGLLHILRVRTEETIGALQDALKTLPENLDK